MDYQRIYDEFITDRRSKEAALIASGEYKERHHIVPKAIKVDNSDANLVYLTAGDHYFAHLCLAQTYGGKMWGGVYAIAGMDKTGKRRVEAFSKRPMVAVARKKRSEAMQGGKHSDETIAKIREVAKGRPVSAEARAKIAAANSGRYVGGDSVRALAVRNIDTGAVFGAITEAARAYGVTDMAIGMACNGKRDTAAGFRWEYVDASRRAQAEARRAKRMGSRKVSGADHVHAVGVINIETNEVFPTITAAAQAMGVSSPAIKQAIRRGGRCKGFHWAFA